MRYTTDLMEQIITSPAARESLNHLAPIYGDGRVALWLFQVIGAELDDMKRWAEETAEQVVPQTATWALDFWEQMCGLPRDRSLSTEKRRERLLSHIANRTVMNPRTLARIASAAAENAEVRIEERSNGGSVFTVWISSMPSDTDLAKIIAAVNRAKPARLSFDVKYEQHAEGTMYAAGYLQFSDDITIRQR